MSLLDKREKSFEDMYAQRETTSFLALMEALHKLHAWASEKLGHSAEMAADYHDELHHMYLKTGDTKHIISNIADEFLSYNLPETRFVIEAQLNHLLAEATARHYAQI